MFAIVRHGAHAFYPDHLTKAGQEMVKKVAEELRYYGPWQAIHVSPRLRTQETGRIIADAFQLSLVIDEALLEEGDHEIWMPPNRFDKTILVTHAPVIRRLATRWMNALNLPNYKPLNLAAALLIDPDQPSAQLLDLDRSLENG